MYGYAQSQKNTFSGTRGGKSIDQLVQNAPVDGFRVKFKKGTTEFLNAEEEELFNDFLDELYWAAEVTIHGYASSDGPEDLNFELSNARALEIERRIRERYPHKEIHRTACGEVEGEHEDNRCVVLNYLSLEEANEAVLEPVHEPVVTRPNIIPELWRTRSDLEATASQMPIREIEDGWGPTNRQNFSLTVEISHDEFLRVRDQYANDPSVFNNNAMATYYPLGERYNRGENLAVGDHMFIDIDGPLNGFVRFTDIMIEDDEFLIEGMTLESGTFSMTDNHPDAGRIQFRGRYGDVPGYATFEIENVTQLGSWMTYFSGPSSIDGNIARGAQKEQWIEVINNIEEFVGVDGEKWMSVEKLNKEGKPYYHNSYHW